MSPTREEDAVAGDDKKHATCKRQEERRKQKGLGVRMGDISTSMSLLLIRTVSARSHKVSKSRAVTPRVPQRVVTLPEASPPLANLKVLTLARSVFQ